MLKKITLATLLAIPSLSVASGNTVNPLIQFGYDWGGTTLATVHTYYDGENTIRAGGGLNLETGAVFGNPQSDLELQLLVGYKVDQESASNGEVTWDRIPFTAMAMVQKKKWKFGGGVTYHLNPHLSGSFSGFDNTGTYFNDTVNDKYENAVGGVAQVQFMATDALAIGLKGTFIEYKLKSNSSVVAKGNSIGINLTYTFGKPRSEFR